MENLANFIGTEVEGGKRKNASKGKKKSKEEKKSSLF
jgi:hypothetical protein